MEKIVLVFNCGSSSVKFALVNPKSGENVLTGIVQCIATKDATVTWKHELSNHIKKLPDVNYESALMFVVDIISKTLLPSQQVIAVGHRVVHGGEHFTKSVVIDNNVLKAIDDCKSLAPLHNPAHILGIKIAKKAYSNLSHVAVFDTAFHQTMPQHAYLYPIPYELYKKYKIRKYGFHGTSHRFISQEAASILNIPYKKASFITAHLGNGCSACAILNGKSVDTTMGLTPLEGLVMGTRSGDVDPGLHAYLVDRLGYDIHRINALLNKESGLLGISGIGSDMRTIESAVLKGDERAILAMEIFCYRLAKHISAIAVSLARIDALIFSGGIGENSSLVRKKTIDWLKVLNFMLDVGSNDCHGKENSGIITKQGSAVAMVVKTNEELLIARDTMQLIL